MLEKLENKNSYFALSSDCEAGRAHDSYETCLVAWYLQICNVYIQHSADEKGNLKFTSEAKIVYESKGFQIRCQQLHRSNTLVLQTSKRSGSFHLVCVSAAVMTDKPDQAIFKRCSDKMHKNA